MRRIVLALFLCSVSISSAQHVQWASKVLGFSTEYTDDASSAKQALGKPNVVPTGGDSPMAWAVGKGDDEGHELKDPAYIKLGYATPMKIQQVAIAENSGPGAVTKVILYDTKGDDHEVYSADGHTIDARSRIFNIFFPMTTYEVEAVEVRIDPNVDDWNEIDAVGISDSPDSVKWRINVVKDLKFPEPPQNLGTNVNTRYSDLIDAITTDGRTMYVSRSECPDNVGGVEGGRDVYVTNLQSDGTWSEAVSLGRPINNKGHNFVNAVTPDGNTLLLGNLYDSDGEPNGSGVSFSHRTMNGWSMPEKIDIKNYYNNSKSASFFLTPDGKGILMTCKRDDTFGDNDIYISFRQDDGTWSEPLNLGPDVNTGGNEVGPFIAADGVTLYYSTNGLSGYGRNDIFMSRRLDNTWTKWSEPENLGPVINTPKFDAYYTLTGSGEYAYYSSKANSFGEDDVFRIKLPSSVKPKPVVLVSGHVYNEKTKAPIEAAIKYELLAGGKEAGLARSDPRNGAYKIVLPAGDNFAFRAEAKGFYAVSENFDTRGVTEYKEINKDLYLAPIEVGQVIRLNNIFFEFAKADLKPESFVELNRVAKFLNENTSIEIALGGHTDNVGSDASNQVLSENRVKSVLAYLQAQNVNPSRMTAKGYGRSKPVASNDTDEGRAMNRRVEFTIVKQ